MIKNKSDKKMGHAVSKRWNEVDFIMSAIVPK